MESHRVAVNSECVARVNGYTGYRLKSIYENQLPVRKTAPQMPDRSITRFIATLKTIYGDQVTPYGTGGDEKHGIGFRIEGVDATFSVLTLEGSLPAGRYDVQIEAYPPGDYLLANEFDAEELIAMIARIVHGERPVI